MEECKARDEGEEGGKIRREGDGPCYYSSVAPTWLLCLRIGTPAVTEEPDDDDDFSLLGLAPPAREEDADFLLELLLRDRFTAPAMTD